jgi:multidrug transporter EmrE-like cation transporter
VIKIYLSLLFANVFAVIAQLSLKKIAINIDKLPETLIIKKIMYVFQNSFLYIALLSYGMCLLLSIYFLTKLEVSRAIPINYAIGFILAALASNYIFSEKLSLVNYVGVIIVLIGVLLITK